LKQKAVLETKNVTLILQVIIMKEKLAFCQQYHKDNNPDETKNKRHGTVLQRYQFVPDEQRSHSG
jgi:hypothetical protein